MNFQRLLNSDLGRIFLSIILGLGLATMFRKVCTGSKCLTFNGPVISEVDGNTYQFGEYCYKYELHPSKCDNKRKTIKFPMQTEEKKTPSSIMSLWSNNQ